MKRAEMPRKAEPNAVNSEPPNKRTRKDSDKEEPREAQTFVVGGVTIGLRDLLDAVSTAGGYDKVQHTKQWSAVARSLHIKCASGGSQLHTQYKKYVAASEPACPTSSSTGTLAGGSVTHKTDTKLAAKGKHDTWGSECTYCTEGGDLLCCDSCVRVFHLRCLRLVHVPNGRWECPLCRPIQCGPHPGEHCGPEDDGWQEFCEECGNGGDLMCCDLCPRVYHAKCLKLTLPPADDWACPHCVKLGPVALKPLRRCIACAETKTDKVEDAYQCRSCPRWLHAVCMPVTATMKKKTASWQCDVCISVLRSPANNHGKRRFVKEEETLHSLSLILPLCRGFPPSHFLSLLGSKLEIISHLKHRAEQLQVLR